MDGQVLGGGVIVLVAVALWLVYLVPSWAQRRQFDAAERNAVRLSQALRVLAETSETPEEVRLELSARTASAQHRLAREAMAERERAALERARAEAEVARIEAATLREQARADTAVAKERARGAAMAARERSRAESALAKAAPAARRDRARRRARLTVTLVGVVAVGLGVWGGLEVVSGGSQIVLWTSAGALGLCALLLHRMSAVQRRGAVRAVEPDAVRVATVVQDVALDADRTGWMPRELPRPLSSSAGSRAAAVLDGAAAREQVRQAAREEAMRERAARAAPPSIAVARAARPAAHDDAAIEAHVRELLQRRAAGQ